MSTVWILLAVAVCVGILIATGGALRLRRRLGGIQIQITRDQAVELAKQKCAREGWSWSWGERPYVSERLTGFVIPMAYRSNPPSYYLIDGRTGAVTRFPER